MSHVVAPPGAGLTKRQITRVHQAFTTLPLLPNSFPFNEMLFRHILKLGPYVVKTRSWDWKYRGLVLLYTSTSRAMVSARAYDLDPKKFPNRAIVGVAELVDVRPLTRGEKNKLICQFNNIPIKRARRIRYNDELLRIRIPVGGGTFVNSEVRTRFVRPFPNGLFFRNIKQFKNPVSFKWPAGPIKPIYVPVSIVTKELKAVGIDPSSIL